MIIVKPKKTDVQLNLSYDEASIIQRALYIMGREIELNEPGNYIDVVEDLEGIKMILNNLKKEFNDMEEA